MSPGTAEFGFELLVCRWAETSWPPDESREDAVIVARQLGTRKRRWDTVVLECDPAGLAARAQFGERELDSDLLHVVRNAPAEWAWYRDALPDPGYPWRYVRAAVHRAADRGVVETRRDGNRIQIRQVAPYPEWLRRIVAVENKPDLDASAARSLSEQLTHDVETALADEVWVATEATDSRIEPALLEDLPVDVGILAVSFDGSSERRRRTAGEFGGVFDGHVSGPDRDGGAGHDQRSGIAAGSPRVFVESAVRLGADTGDGEECCRKRRRGLGTDGTGQRQCGSRVVSDQRAVDCRRANVCARHVSGGERV